MSVVRVTEQQLAHCASEPIHVPGRTQAFGVLLAFDEKRRIVAASGNAGAWCGVDAPRLIGRSATTALPDRSLAAAEAHARVAAHRQAAQHLFGVAWPGRDTPVDVSVHAVGRLVVVEAEDTFPAAITSPQPFETSALEVAQATDIASLAESAARAVAAVTGHDRVMVYRFAADGSGTVIAERHAPGMQSYVGLRYPASDIPAQARDLYLRNPVRVVVDAHEAGLPLATLHEQALDLSLATLRSVSPVHLQYMRNMGVAASMSISLVVDGRLWGLIACHHRQPMRPPLARRSMAELLGRLYSLAISRIERRTLDRDLKALVVDHPGVDSLLAVDVGDPDHAETCASVARLLGVSGIAVHLEGRTSRWGESPAEADIAQLVESLPDADRAHVLAVESLAALSPRWRRLAPRTAGLLALPLGGTGHDCVLLLRDEVRRHVVWAGDPGKAVDPDTGRLMPRASFAAWRESVHWHCEPWTVAEVELAEAMRARLIEALLAQREQRELDRTRRYARQQALLVRELNHRVRNMLGLIKGLVQQTARTAASVEDLANRLHDRVHALSRAYAQVERSRWQPAPLRQLLADEARAFGEPGQVVLEGPPIDLEPNTYLAFALVLHEMATNARKYGSLSDAGGRLHVRWQVSAAGALELDWHESGGPRVRRNRRQGFGTRVIGQALAHQLGGSATLDFAEPGLHARLAVPRGFVEGRPFGLAADRDSRRPRRRIAAPHRALVVEDDLVIALLAETLLQHLGCRDVVVTGSAADALAALKHTPVDVALLDVHLGDHDSRDVAARLRDLGVPAIVATGYGDTDHLPESLRGLPRVNKPYGEVELERALHDALAPRADDVSDRPA